MVTLIALFFLLWQALPFAVARPALLGFALLAATVALTYMDRRPLWLLPVFFWLWASVHGMFVVGLAYLLLDGLRRGSRRQVIASVFAGVATAFTAHGLGAWWILIQFFRSQGALDFMAEWDPPDFSNPYVIPLLVVILGIVVAGTLRLLRPADLWVIVPFITFGLMAGRNIWPAVIVLSPIAARCFQALPERARSHRPELAIANWVIAAALVAVGVFGVTRVAELREDRFPVQAAVAALDSGPLFNDTAVGGYLIYAEWPERKVFIDDRAELYGEEGLQRFQDLKAGSGVEETFAEFGIEQVIVVPDWPLVEYLEVLGWQYRYEDEFFVVMASS